MQHLRRTPARCLLLLLLQQQWRLLPLLLLLLLLLCLPWTIWTISFRRTASAAATAAAA
jgi:hypothetical protein